MGDALDKANLIWNNLLTPGQLRSLGIKDEDETKPNKRPRRKEHSGSSTKSSDPDLKQMVQVMAKIVMRQEDTINVLLQEFEFVLYLQPGEGSLLPTLINCHRTWQNSDKSQSLRHTMALTMVETLKERLDKLVQAPVTAEVFQDCVKYNLINSNREMPYLRWDVGSQQLVPSKEKALPIGEVQNILMNILKILQQEPEITLRFHALTKLQQEDASQRSIPFLWTVGHRTQGELWNLLRTVSFHSIWQLVRLTLRPQTQQRSALTKQLAKMM